MRMRRSFSTKIWMPLAAALLLLGCEPKSGEDAVGAPEEDGATGDGRTLPELGQPEAGETDLPGGDAQKPDGLVPRETVGEQTTPEETAEDPCLASPLPDGCPCTEGTDCASGVCNDDGFVKTCGAECATDSDCGPGEVCIVEEGAGSCVLLWGKVCNPCKGDEECAVDLPDIGVCLSLGSQGSFCTILCGDASACPEGYVCADTPDGTACKPKFGICGCSDSAIEQQLATDCYVTNEHGTCTGQRSCQAEGLTDCSAPAPAEEQCDGLDNDCDGGVDLSSEGSALQKACTAVACDLPGTMTCENGFWSACEAEGLEEICDGLDNDCDGSVDEDWPDLNTICAVGIGACLRQGIVICKPDQEAGAGCSVEPGDPAAEVCDGLDNDCDEETDEEGAEECKAYFQDADGDGHGWAETQKCLCAPAAPFSTLDATDCDDAAADVSPSAKEACDGKDNNCDQEIDGPGSVSCAKFHLDADGDGFGVGDALCLCAADVEGKITATVGGDCDDSDPMIAPVLGLELCDGKDNNCDGLIDVSQGGNFLIESCYAGPEETAGLGICEAGMRICNKGSWSKCIGEVLPKTDVCDGIDNDCDQLVDEDADGNPLSEACYEAAAGTAGKGECVKGTRSCMEGLWTECEGQVLPETEACDNLDNDCDDKVDEGCDDDDDGYCDGTMDVAEGCETCPNGGGDPNDDEGGVNPGAAEKCNGLDDDVDGQIDEEGAMGCKTWFLDADGDGYGTDDGKCLCGALGLYKTLKEGDCDDALVSVNEGHSEACDGVDNDCDALVDEKDAFGCIPYFLDQDGDGFGVAGTATCLCGPQGNYDSTKAGDCNDGTAEANPNHAEVCDGKDNDCNGKTDEPGALTCKLHFQDADGDGYGTGIPVCLCGPDVENGYVVEKGGDCQDQDPTINPAIQEVCDAKDNNCDGLVDSTGAGTPLVTSCYNGEEGTAGVGVCQEGLTFCAAGVWSKCIGEKIPTPEVCDLLDNNCNAVADEELAETCFPKEYTQEEAFWGMSPCTPGTTVCEGGKWSACADYVLPQPEICVDQIDNDCNGALDEQGMCADACVDNLCDFKAGNESNTPFNTEDNAAGCDYNCGYNVGKDADGNLILDVTANLIDLPFMWVANDSDNTISKVDTKDGKELARYTVGPECVSPSRTAVEENGSVWVGCRTGSRIVKIAAHKKDCVDKNGDGTIDTMWIEYGQGGTKTLHTLPWSIDECVLYNGTPPVGPSASADLKANPAPSGCNIYIRAVGVTKKNTVLFGGLEGCVDGHIWEASYTYDPAKPFAADSNPKVVLVDHWYTPNLEHKDWDGQACSFGNAPGGSYGYAIDKKGNLWASSLVRSQLYWLDLDQRRSCSWPVDTPYGIAIDYAGRIWLGSWSSGNPMGHVFIPETKTMFNIDKNLAGGNWWDGSGIGSGQLTRGVAVSVDPEKPYAYFAISNGIAGLIRVKVTDENKATFQARVEGILRTSNGGVCANSGSASGMGIDGEGDIWLINMDVCGVSNFDGKNHGGAVAMEFYGDKIVGWKHPSSGTDVQAVMKTIADVGSHAYTYSDFMGYQFATVVNPMGFYIQRFNGWGGEDMVYTTQWKTVKAYLVGGAANPPLYLAWRTGKTPAETSAAAFSADIAFTCAEGICSADLPAAAIGAFLDAKIILKTDDQGGSVTLSSILASGQRIKAK